MRRKKEGWNRVREKMVEGKREGREEEELEEVWEEGSARLWEDSEGVKHNSPVKVLKEKAHPQHLSHGLDTQGLGDMPQAGAMAIYLCVPRTQRPCHILGVRYTFIEFDLK